MGLIMTELLLGSQNAIFYPRAVSGIPLTFSLYEVGTHSTSLKLKESKQTKA